MAGKSTENKHTVKKIVITAVILLSIALILLFLFHSNPLDNPGTTRLKKISGVSLVVVVCVLFCIFFDQLKTLPLELYQSRGLIWKLAKNDFKKRYAGSYLGAVWAMAQPVVTVLMYWIVFDKVFNTRSQMIASGVEVPYVLFLTAGLVPWFFFQEGTNHGMMAMIEYNYLVKKVVFNISVLPIIKVIGAWFTHIFFVGVLILVSALYGYTPTVYTIQIVYYDFCLFLLVLALAYINCAIVVFFRDLQQIVAILLQIGMWATPILWDIHMVPDQLKPLFKLNPMVYIVNGFRMSMYGDEWFWQHFYSSAYFWILLLLLFTIGSIMFKKLKVHFADVL
ncbi:MAG: ABC transporter permease [Lachnospiraceae bacterium]|nr:ABC transporter permease [Lachnospiraceae bacterium]